MIKRLKDFPRVADGDFPGIDQLVRQVADRKAHETPARVGQGGGNAILKAEKRS